MIILENIFPDSYIASGISMSDLYHMVSVHIITPLKSTSSLLPKANILQTGSSVIILMNLGINGIMNIREN